MGGALELAGPRPFRGLFSILDLVVDMKMSRPKSEESEPMGIVISRGTREEPTPAVFAYIWGPAPKAPVAQAPRAA